MAPVPPSPVLAAQARRFYYDVLMRELPRCVKAVVNGARELMTQVSNPDQVARRRDLVMDLPRQAPRWQQAMGGALGLAATPGSHGARSHAPARQPTRASELSLVDDDTIELEIIASCLALGMMDKASWEFSDLRYRMSSLERREEMEPQDLLRPLVLARAAVDGWRSAGLSIDHWRTAQALLHEEFAGLIQEGYHETNRWLIGQGVCPEVNLRPFIRRSRDTGVGASAAQGGGSGGTGSGSGAGGATSRSGGTAGSRGAASAQGSGSAPGMAEPAPRYPTPSGLNRDRIGPTPETAHQFAPTQVAGLPPGAFPRGAAAAFGDSGSSPRSLRGDVHEETRLMTRSPGLLRSIEQAEAVLGRLNRLVSRQVPEFSGSTIALPHSASPGLRAAIHEAEQAVRRRFDVSGAGAAAGGTPSQSGAAGGAAAGAAASTPTLLQELQARKQALKQAATTPVERATIEIVALMFQSLLTEERIPATVRVWFARLQMPVLRVAIAEPDFFGSIDHPARKLIDRMGACVMGFEAGNAGVSEPLEKEIKRIVQVVEAYPDTGRRVFQTVLTEFERFLENYFKTTHAAATKGVSLAQQIEQRETLAIQYTIELRKMLNEVPVHEGVREFLFHIWADVLATTAVKAGQSSESTKQMQRAAADLIWLASAKVSREERSEAIRRLPPLLKKLREGMGVAGVPNSKQDEYIQALNNSLQAAFSARTATIPTERLDELMMQLETLEDMLPDIGTVEIDESMIRDLSGHDSQELEVVSEGGSMPTPAMLAWAGEMQVGAWFKLDWRNRIDPVQLAWQGLRKQMCLFVTPQGRGIMFQRHRLASFLQAGLLVPVEEESLTVRATRDALAKLDADPDRLLH
ncbi:DUF1631 family protein [Sphaerotilus microaerophilus]|uniref:DUF1631 domain-containing protein n=1 Tax=Sphaerotilus microaerophilus TaxID=2914710 RepID=A0ABM7YFP3_9BURK|nr:DUF1631 family protein [Sphaerotilus sp. FB-5]BDI03067.1 hypothetical protein CATMQ487_00370 [Sphaerotilus sp. FB-5]